MKSAQHNSLQSQVSDALQIVIQRLAPPIISLSLRIMAIFPAMLSKISAKSTGWECSSLSAGASHRTSSRTTIIQDAGDEVLPGYRAQDTAIARITEKPVVFLANPDDIFSASTVDFYWFVSLSHYLNNEMLWMIYNSFWI